MIHKIFDFRTTQSATQAMDSNGNLFFGLVGTNQIAYWDSQTKYVAENICVVAQNDKTLQFAGGLKVIKNRRSGKEELWALTNRLQVGSISNI
jgi:hypothetical protein